MIRRSIDSNLAERLESNRATRVLASATGALHERRRQRTETLGTVLRSLVTATVFSVAFVMILDELAIPIAPLLASAGVAGVALGFGAQSLVKDFISGVFMLVEDQYGVGDVIDTGEAIGTVEDVTLRVTRLRDGNGVVWYVRNGEIVRVGNRSQGSSSTSGAILADSYPRKLARRSSRATACKSAGRLAAHFCAKAMGPLSSSGAGPAGRRSGRSRPRHGVSSVTAS